MYPNSLYMMIKTLHQLTPIYPYFCCYTSQGNHSRYTWTLFWNLLWTFLSQTFVRAIPSVWNIFPFHFLLAKFYAYFGLRPVGRNLFPLLTYIALCISYDIYFSPQFYYYINLCIISLFECKFSRTRTVSFLQSLYRTLNKCWMN